MFIQEQTSPDHELCTSQCVRESASAKESQQREPAQARQQTTRPLNDHQEANSIELLSSSSLDIRTINALSHYDAHHSIVKNAQCRRQASGNDGTSVLSHYADRCVSGQTLVELDAGSGTNPSICSRLSHHPDFAYSLSPTTAGYSALHAAGAVVALGPPPLEHLPNYCTLDGHGDLNSSTNNSAPTLLHGPQSNDGDSVTASGPCSSVAPHLPLTPLAVPAPPLLKAEPPSTHLDSDLFLWKSSSSIDQAVVAVSSAGSSGNARLSLSPPPLAHPPVSCIHTTTCSSVDHFPQPTSIVFYGPPQGMLINTLICLHCGYIVFITMFFFL